MSSMRFEKGQRGQDVLLLDPPYEMVGHFLTLEGSHLDSWPLTVLLPALEAVRRRDRGEFAYGGNAFSVEVSQETVVIQFVAFEAPDECRIPLEAFYEVLIAWRDHLQRPANGIPKRVSRRRSESGQPRMAGGEFHRYGDEKLTWAGECPWTRGFCFGTESGKLLVPPSTSLDLRTIGLESGINGVTFGRELIGVSSRTEILLARASPYEQSFSRVNKFRGGANGIVSTPTGNFVAPRGKNGIILIQRDGNPMNLREREIGLVDGRAVDYHHLVLAGRRGADVLACAGRGTGLLAVTCDWVKMHSVVIAHTFAQQDIIDVCSIRSREWPLAIAAVGRDKTIFLTRDVIRERPVAITLALSGTSARCILGTEGHLFLLTDQALYVLPRLATRFLSGERLDYPTPLSEMPAPDSFAHLAYDRYFLLGSDEEVFSVDIGKLIPVQEGERGKRRSATDISTSLVHSLPDVTPSFRDFPTESASQLDFAFA